MDTADNYTSGATEEMPPVAIYHHRARVPKLLQAKHDRVWTYDLLGWAKNNITLDSASDPIPNYNFQFAIEGSNYTIGSDVSELPEEIDHAIRKWVIMYGAPQMWVPKLTLRNADGVVIRQIPLLVGEQHAVSILSPKQREYGTQFYETANDGASGGDALLSYLRSPLREHDEKPMYGPSVVKTAAGERVLALTATVVARAYFDRGFHHTLSQALQKSDGGCGYLVERDIDGDTDLSVITYRFWTQPRTGSYQKMPTPGIGYAPRPFYSHPISAAPQGNTIMGGVPYQGGAWSALYNVNPYEYMQAHGGAPMGYSAQMVMNQIGALQASVSELRMAVSSHMSRSPKNAFSSPIGENALSNTMAEGTKV